MHAILTKGKGSAEEVLQWEEITTAEMTTPSEVKIKIKAAGVNPIDTKVRRNGGFYSDEKPEFILGCDGAGEVVEVGGGVKDFQVGDAVWFCHGGLGREQGNYAEYTVVDHRWLVLKPKNISFIEAAAMPLALITAWNALFEKGGLTEGQTVLIHAGAGGVGHLAIQLAKLKGAKVITTISSDAKSDFVKALGADEVINYRQADVVSEVSRLTNQEGCDLVIDTVGGADIFKESVLATRYFGRLITLLDPTNADMSVARMKNLLVGFELMLTPMLKDLESERKKQIDILKQCAIWVEQGVLKVHVSTVFLLEQAVLAHAKIEEGKTMGKIVLAVEKG